MRKLFLFIVVSIVISAYAYASPISQQWVKSYLVPGNIGIIEQTTDGGYVGAGSISSDSPWTSILVRKLDYNGEISWEKTYAYGDWMNEASTIVQTTDGGYIVGGHTSAHDSYDKAWLLKLDSNGDITWQKTYNEVWRVHLHPTNIRWGVYCRWRLYRRGSSGHAGL